MRVEAAASMAAAVSNGSMRKTACLPMTLM